MKIRCVAAWKQVRSTTAFDCPRLAALERNFAGVPAFVRTRRSLPHSLAAETRAA
jgi:hypothetical protein